MSSRPDSPGRPRSMTTISSGYSRPANRPSSPSRATSTVKPASPRRACRLSRSDASSSTTSARMPLPGTLLSLHRAAGGVDAYRPHLARIVQQPQHIERAARVLLRLGPHDAGVVTVFDHPDRLVHGHG